MDAVDLQLHLKSHQVLQVFVYMHFMNAMALQDCLLFHQVSKLLVKKYFKIVQVYQKIHILWN